MVYTRFVQVGRVAYVAFGNEKEKLVAIADIIDTNRVLVDGPHISRQVLNLKSLHLTKYVLKIQHGVRKAALLKAWNKAEVDKKWAESSWSKRLNAKKLRSELTDFQRFKLMRAKQARNRLITLEAGKLKLKAKKANAGGKADKKPAAAKKAVAKK